MKLKLISFIIAILVFLSFGSATPVYADNSVYLGGMTAGFSLYTRGGEIIGLCDVITEKGLVSPLKDVGIKEGDVILKINDCEINNATDIHNCIKNGENLIIEYNHDGQNYIKQVKPVKDLNGHYKLGIFIRDGINGIGTITYIKGNRFASLGHPVVDENGEEIKICGGKLYNCSITGFQRGERGKVGELKGAFIKNNPIAKIEKNLDSGVYGEISDQYNTDKLTKISIGNATMGDAYIYSTIEGEIPKQYSISIVKIDDVGNKNFVVKITDKSLLEKTGGIVQGMSGSPIIQNDKLVGAITHVFINDPTRGFGIKINKMINN